MIARTISVNSETWSIRASSVSVARPAPIADPTRTISTVRPRPGSASASCRSTPQATSDITRLAASILIDTVRRRRPLSGPRRSRNRYSSRTALASALIEVPTARPVYPKRRTISTLSTALTTTMTVLTTTGVRLWPIA